MKNFFLKIFLKLFNLVKTLGGLILLFLHYFLWVLIGFIPTVLSIINILIRCFVVIYICYFLSELIMSNQLKIKSYFLPYFYLIILIGIQSYCLYILFLLIFG